MFFGSVCQIYHAKPRGFRQISHGQINQRGCLKRSARAVRPQCARSATIWACGRTGDPCFEIIGASLLPCCVGFDALSTLGM